MTTTTFDTLEFAEKLKAAGFTDEQARAQARALSKAMESKGLATKVDLKDLEYRLTITLGRLMIAGFGALATIIKMH
ncbi:MAG: DUF1640 domain-containing protein [Magnetococcales bacterium]|nr:DUF1640 domain-containing protein [Magnetococcales bacterium]